MTPFMERVLTLADARPDGLVAPVTRPSVPRPVGVGTEEQVVFRSLAEQLVCEANAVLDGPEKIALTDLVLDDRLSFDIRYRARSARIETLYIEGHSIGRLVGDANVMSGPRRLEGPEELKSVILLLLGDPEIPARSPEPGRLLETAGDTSELV